MARIPVLKATQVVAALQRAGFYVHHQTGSHVRLLHRLSPDLRVTIPMHTGDVPPSLLKHRILKQADLSEEDFLRLL